MADPLAACGGPTTSKGGSNTLSQLAGVLPDCVPVNYVKPDFPAVTGPAGVASPAACLKWPAKQVRAVPSAVAAGSVTATTPAFRPIRPQPNAYFDAVNKRLGANVTFQIVNGNDGRRRPRRLSGNPAKLPWRGVAWYVGSRPDERGTAAAPEAAGHRR
jgi:putative aldouronate transport system substrate-binding protein